MEYTGERMMPEVSVGAPFWEHVHRYRFANRYAPGRAILDVASGEGYGAHALALAGASSVVGVDVSAEACDHARRTYGVDARVGDALALPLADGAVDLVVSFETIEHVPDPARFLDECARVLRPGGILVISTPDKEVYDGLHTNEFHCSELTEGEFAGLLAARFDDPEWYGQSPVAARWWSTRSLVAARSPWRGIKGFGLLARLACPHYHGRITDHERGDIAATILQARGVLSGLMDPFRVRPRRRWTGERPTYLVAVARRR